MGYGDKLMAIGEAWALHQADPERRLVAIGNGEKVDECALFEGLSFLARQHHVETSADVIWHDSYPSNRPYIDYAAMRTELFRLGRNGAIKQKKLVANLGRYIFKPYTPKPAPILLTPAERAWADEALGDRPFIAIEPHIKTKAPQSKQWPTRRMAEVVRGLRLSGWRVVQVSAPEKPPVEGAERIAPPSFRHALAALERASLFIGMEGGLHHGCAAVGTPAVVIFGGFVSPESTGYAAHINLTGGATYACGTRYERCSHCEKAMDAISPNEVLAAAETLLTKSPSSE